MRFKLHAFVCESDCVEETPHIGWMTVTQIAMERRSGCRYAIVEDRAGAFQVWDFYDDDTIGMVAGIDTKPEFRSFPTADAAISAVVMRYDKGMWYALWLL